MSGREKEFKAPGKTELYSKATLLMKYIYWFISDNRQRAEATYLVTAKTMNGR